MEVTGVAASERRRAGIEAAETQPAQERPSVTYVHPVRAAHSPAGLSRLQGRVHGVPEGVPLCRVRPSREASHAAGEARM